MPEDSAPTRSPFRDFPFSFWFINGIELFERAAYYGTTAVLAFYMNSYLGISLLDVGLLFSILLPLLYFVPIVAAAFAEKYGFRKALVVAMVVAASGYALLGFLTTLGGLIFATLLVGIGAGIFKPLPPAIIGQVTRPEARNLGYSVYYWAVNVGAFFTPLAIGFYLPERLYGFALYLAAALMLLNLALVLLFYRNVTPPQSGLDILGSLRSLSAIAADRGFLVLLLIYSGFWFMYGINLSFLPIYMDRFVDMPAWFAVAYLGSVNPGTIILLGPAIARLTGKLPSLPLMTSGIGVYVLGILVMGSSANPWVFVGGIVLYSAGEFVVQPSFLSYVSKIAPADRVAVYMGYSFLPIGFGFFLSGYVTGWLFEVVLEGLGNPLLFWGIIASVGLLSIAGFLFYNAGVARKDSARERRGVFAGPLAGLVVLLLIPALLGAGALAGTVGPDAPRDEGPLGRIALPPVEGTTLEGEASNERVVLPASARGNVSFLLEWTDESPLVPAVANAPDRFRLTVIPPVGRPASAEAANPAGSPGKIELAVPVGAGLAPGEYDVTIEVLEAGDQASVIPLGTGPAQDTGNAWRLTASYEGPSSPASAG